MLKHFQWIQLLTLQINYIYNRLRLLKNQGNFPNSLKNMTHGVKVGFYSVELTLRALKSTHGAYDSSSFSAQHIINVCSSREF